ncbi:hypothetical protein TY91_00460 [Secundilactobacillus collinoides]|uniref:Uncharacterized protein n=1 Tax=Secundilactobacillus collinoides TaxID=33960 RepID=A0A166HWI6_SECCO|nr:hypothetical protein TY91_00460 [Secundilactobacillus collinoides]
MYLPISTFTKKAILAEVHTLGKVYNGHKQFTLSKKHKSGYYTVGDYDDEEKHLVKLHFKPATYKHHKVLKEFNNKQVRYMFTSIAVAWTI